MKIKLLDYPISSVSDGLTLGKYYECTEVHSDHYVIVDDDGDEHEVEKECFEGVSKELSKQAPGMGSITTLDKIKTFTMNHKNLEISFEDGIIILRDWDIRNNQPMDYRCDTIEQIGELMGAWEKLCKFKVENV